MDCRKIVTPESMRVAGECLLNAACALRGMLDDMIEYAVKIGERLPRIAQPHRPCFDQTARTSASVANSSRSAAASERASAASSSGGQLQNRLLIAGELQHDSGHLVLQRRRKSSRGFKSLL